MIETSDIISPPLQQEPNTTPTPQQSLHQPNPSPTLAIAPPLPPPNRDDYSVLSSYHSDIYGPNAIIQLQAVPQQPQQVTTRYGRTIRAPRRCANGSGYRQWSRETKDMDTNIEEECKRRREVGITV